MQSQITSFYSQTNVLITGGTGFFGKLLIQKLLRSCPDIEGMYLLVRAKRNKTSNERINDIFEDVVFDVLKKEQPNFLNKIHLMEGDCTVLNLGLSEFNKSFIINKINIIFHCAGLVNFTADLKLATHTNVRSLKDLLTLCRDMQNLKSMVFVSTAYSNCQNTTIEEIFYDVPIQPSTLMQFVDDCNENIIACVEKGFLKNSPNTYCFTKSIAENLLLNDGKNLPTCLFRPSIVMSTYVDPIPGWTSNVYGPLGLSVASGSGVLRVINANKHLKVDFVPADYAINSLICVAWETHEKWKSSSGLENFSIPVYNYSGGYERNPKQETLNLRNTTLLFKYPPNNPLWVCWLFLMPNKFAYVILKFLLETIPGNLLDCYLYLSGQKPKLRKIYKKIDSLSDAITYFNTHEWNILNYNVQHLWERLNKTDQKLFPFDMNLLNYEEYYDNIAAGLKLYILKENFDNLVDNRKNYKRLQKIHYATLTILTMLFLLFCYTFLNNFFLLL